jgi:hypothetical protein
MSLTPSPTVRLYGNLSNTDRICSGLYVIMGTPTRLAQSARCQHSCHAVLRAEPSLHRIGRRVQSDDKDILAQLLKEAAEPRLAASVKKALGKGHSADAKAQHLTWTIEKPTAPGWYWHRKDEQQSQVLMQVQGVGEHTTAVGPKGQWDPVFSMSGEWSGPLEPTA